MDLSAHTNVKYGYDMTLHKSFINNGSLNVCRSYGVVLVQEDFQLLKVTHLKQLNYFLNWMMFDRSLGRLADFELSVCLD